MRSQETFGQEKYSHFHTGKDRSVERIPTCKFRIRKAKSENNERKKFNG